MKLNKCLTAAVFAASLMLAPCANGEEEAIYTLLDASGREITQRGGQMYVGDERFKKNIDKHADGTAEFVCEAIKIYCRK